MRKQAKGEGTGLEECDCRTPAERTAGVDENGVTVSPGCDGGPARSTQTWAPETTPQLKSSSVLSQLGDFGHFTPSLGFSSVVC